MTIRGKTLVAIGGTLVCLTGILCVTMQQIVLRSFGTLERESTFQDVERGLSALRHDIAGLHAKASDWADWDDAYTFIEDGNSAFIKTNLADKAFANLHVDLMLFVHRSGRIVFSKALDLQSGKHMPPPEDLRDHLSVGGPLVNALGPIDGVAGILCLRGLPLLVTARPIRTSEGKGPPRGTLIWGRYLDDDETRRLSQLTHLSLTFHRFDGPPLPPDVQAVRSSWAAATPIVTRPLNNKEIAGYAVFRDVYDSPAIVLQVKAPRAIYRQGQIGLYYLVASLVVGAAVFGALVVGMAHLAAVAIHSRRQFQGLHEATSFLQQVLDTAATAVFTVDVEKRITSVNEAFCAITGFTREEVLGRSCDILRGEPCTRKCGLFNGPPGSRVYRKECAVHAKDGHKLTILKNANLVFDDRGRLTGGIESFVDVTELMEARWRAESANRAKSEFLAAMSHEMRTPMNGIMTFASLLKRGALDESERDYVDTILVSSRHLLMLINEILDFAKIESGRFETHKTTFEPTALVDEVVSMLAAQAGEKGLTLTADHAPDLPDRICSDRVRLRQALINLVGNAIKFTEKGGIVVRTQLVECPPHRTIQFCVSDTGIGIPQDKIGVVFQPFEQVDSSTTRRYGGTGLGLAITRHIAEMLGGSVTVTSQLGKGSTFVVSIDPGPMLEPAVVG